MGRVIDDQGGHNHYNQVKTRAKSVGRSFLAACHPWEGTHAASCRSRVPASSGRSR